MTGMDDERHPSPLEMKLPDFSFVTTEMTWNGFFAITHLHDVRIATTDLDMSGIFFFKALHSIEWVRTLRRRIRSCDSSIQSWAWVGSIQRLD